jgi:hypothetical protein
MRRLLRRVKAWDGFNDLAFGLYQERKGDFSFVFQLGYQSKPSIPQIPAT